jgi:2-polyprenyl-3-methyl-5-hydroxy-6-metoxy-1,4-benzoquinol methylase
MALQDTNASVHPQRCGCCHAEDTTSLCTLADDAGSPVALYLCADCGAMTPAYTEQQHQENTRRQTAYYENKWSTDTDIASDQLAEDFRGVVRFYREHGFLPAPHTTPFVVDIGAGRGALVEALRREDYVPIGAEPAEGLVKRAQAHYGMPAKILQCMTAEAFITQLTAEQKKIDAAFLWHVIEHVKQPAQLLLNIAATLKNEGVIILQAPLPLPSSIFPEHLYLLTRKTVFSLARMSGLSVAFCDISHQEQFISFVLCKPTSSWKKITPDHTHVLDQWITDLHAAITDQGQTCTWQRNVLAEQAVVINQQKQALDNPVFLAKQLLHVLFRGKSHG